MNKFLVTLHFKKNNLVVHNVPAMYRTRSGFDFFDVHWIAVLLANEKNTTIDYLDYTDAADGSASLLALPRYDHIRISC